jgi:hypothetical protein
MQQAGRDLDALSRWDCPPKDPPTHQ